MPMFNNSRKGVTLSSKTQAINLASTQETRCLRGFANNKGSDQPAHPRRLISAFVIRFLGSTISILAASEISIF